MRQRKPLRRSTKPLKRTRIKTSRKPIRQRRADPSKRAFAKHRVKEFTDWLKTLPCCVTGKRTGEWIQTHKGIAWHGDDEFSWTYDRRCVVVDPAHLIPRGRGSDDLNNTVPLARHLHREQEKRTDEFNAKYGVDLWALAKQYTERFLAEHPSVAARLATQYTEEM